MNNVISVRIGLNAFVILAGALLSTLALRAQQFSNWSAPINLGSAINSIANEQHPTISKDGLTLFFISDSPSGLGDFDLYLSQRDSLDDPWQPAVNVGGT